MIPLEIMWLIKTLFNENLEFSLLLYTTQIPSCHDYEKIIPRKVTVCWMSEWMNDPVNYDTAKNSN